MLHPAQRETNLIERERDAVETRRAPVLATREREARASLERLAGVDVKAAKADCCSGSKTRRGEAMVLMRDLEIRAREEADKRASPHPHPPTVKRLASEGGCRDDVVDGRSSQRRHEGPDHR